MTVRLDADALLRAVSHQMHEELARQGVQLDGQLIDGAAQAVLGMAYGDPTATELVHRLGTENPQLAAVLGTAFAFLKQHPGFWVGWYAHRHHADPLPPDHPWSEAIGHAFGESEAHRLRYAREHEHGGWGEHHAWGHHAGAAPPPPRGGGGGGHPAPPDFSGAHYAHGPRPAAMYQRHMAPPPPPAARPAGYVSPFGYGQQPAYDPSQYQQPAASTDGTQQPTTTDTDDTDALDLSALGGMFSPVAAPGAPAAAPAADPGAAALGAAASAAAATPAAPTATTSGYGHREHMQHVRATLNQWIALLQATPLPPGVSQAQRTDLIQQAFALALSPTLETARAVILHLGQQLAGPESQRWAYAIAQLFPQLAQVLPPPAAAIPPMPGMFGMPTVSGYGGRDEHEHERQRLAQEAAERWEREHGHPAPPHEARPGAPREGWGGHPAPPREGWGGHPGAPQMHNTWQRWQQIHPGSSYEDYQGWWQQHGQYGATIDPDAPHVWGGFPAFASTPMHPEGLGFGVHFTAGTHHGGGRYAPRGRRGGREWWGGWGGWAGPEYVVDQRNELEDAPWPTDMEPDDQRVH